jgi:hypothetical protein
LVSLFQSGIFSRREGAKSLPLFFSFHKNAHLAKQPVAGLIQNLEVSETGGKALDATSFSALYSIEATNRRGKK